MSVSLRIMLIATSLMTLVFVIRKIRKSKMQMFDSIIWILFSVMLVITGVFPDTASYVKSIIGIESSVNCVFLFVSFFLFIEIFSLSAKMSNLEYKMKNAVEYFSVMDNIKSSDSEKKKGIEESKQGSTALNEYGNR